MPAANSLSGVYLLNPSQAQRAIALCWRANVPCALVGGVGCGKTTAVNDFVKTLNNGKGSKFKLWPCILSYLDASDIGGVPVPVRGQSKVVYHMPDFLPFDCEDAGVIFGDEFDRATPEVQNAFLQVLLGRQFHGHTLSENAYAILAMNGTSDIYTTPLSRAARTRICSLFISRHAQGAGESYQEWAEEMEIDTTTRAFARFRADLFRRDEDFEELAQCTPRTVDMVGQIMDVVEVVKFRTDDVLPAVIAGLIGRAAATEYLAIRQLVSEAPTPEEVEKHPTTADIPENPSVKHALISSLLNYLNSDEPGDRRKIARHFVKYAVRMEPEWAAMLLKRLSADEPTVVTTNEFCEWKNDHSALLI